VACLGNHDLDFGEEHCESINAECNFPWLLTNVTKGPKKQQVAKSLPYHCFMHKGIKFGVIGIAEEEWLATLRCFEPGDCNYEDQIKCTNRWAKKLREEHSCDYVIA